MNKLIICLVALIIFCPLIAEAQRLDPTTGDMLVICAAGCISGTIMAAPYGYTPLGYQQITPLASSTSLAVPTGATVAFITSESQAVRYRDDGVAPTASTGQPLSVGAQLIYSGSLAAIRFIQQSATATLDVTYYK